MVRAEVALVHGWSSITDIGLHDDSVVVATTVIHLSDIEHEEARAAIVDRGSIDLTASDYTAPDADDLMVISRREHYCFSLGPMTA